MSALPKKRRWRRSVGLTLSWLSRRLNSGAPSRPPTFDFATLTVQRGAQTMERSSGARGFDLVTFCGLAKLQCATCIVLQERSGQMTRCVPQLNARDPASSHRTSAKRLAVSTLHAPQISMVRGAPEPRAKDFALPAPIDQSGFRRPLEPTSRTRSFRPSPAPGQISYASSGRRFQKRG
jgi:hypothetical protein